MKNIFLLLFFSLAILDRTNAQTTDTTADAGYTAAGPKKVMSPTQRAARQLNILQEKLNLNQDQVIRLRMILLNLNIALDSLRNNPSGDKKADNTARHTITQEADGKTYALLTTEQQLQYAQWKTEQKQKAMEKRLNRQGNNPPPAGNPTPPQNGNPPQQNGAPSQQ